MVALKLYFARARPDLAEALRKASGFSFPSGHAIVSGAASLVGTEIGPAEIHLYKSDDHFRNFIDCVLSRGPTAAPVEVAHRSITICHLGSIAMRLGREALRWDPRTERIVGDDEAAAMLRRPYRDPWTLPLV